MKIQYPPIPDLIGLTFKEAKAKLEPGQLLRVIKRDENYMNFPQDHKEYRLNVTLISEKITEVNGWG